MSHPFFQTPHLFLQALNRLLHYGMHAFGLFHIPIDAHDLGLESVGFYMSVINGFDAARWPYTSKVLKTSRLQITKRSLGKPNLRE